MWLGGSEFDIFSFTGQIDRHSVDAKFNSRPEVKDVNGLPRINLYIFFIPIRAELLLLPFYGILE